MPITDQHHVALGPAEGERVERGTPMQLLQLMPTAACPDVSVVLQVLHAAGIVAGIQDMRCKAVPVICASSAKS